MHSLAFVIISCSCHLTGKVQFEVRGEGGDDEAGMGTASIRVNGQEYCPKKRGHNVVVLDPCGELVVAKAFNTSSPNEARAMAQFLDELPEDHVVLAATQDTTSKWWQITSRAR